MLQSIIMLEEGMALNGGLAIRRRWLPRMKGQGPSQSPKTIHALQPLRFFEKKTRYDPDPLQPTAVHGFADVVDDGAGFAFSQAKPRNSTSRKCTKRPRDMSAPRSREPSSSFCTALPVHVWSCVIPRTLPWACLAAGYTAAIHFTLSCQHWPSLCAMNGESFFFIHPYAYQIILVCSGFALVFRLNLSHARYWEARTAVQNCSAKWLDGAMMAMSFDDDEGFADSSAQRQHAIFASCVLHLASLLHGTAMHTLRGDGAGSVDTLVVHDGDPVPLDVRARSCCSSPAAARSAFEARNPIAVLGGVTLVERRRLADERQRVHLVLGWLTRLLVRRRRRGGMQHDAPIVSRIYQVLSDGALWYLTALKVCDTPFPLPYAQISFFVCLANLALFPLVVADKVASLPLAASISFGAVMLMFSLNEVARELEDPFQSSLSWAVGANRLDAAMLQKLFNQRLLALGAASLDGPHGSIAAAEVAGYDALLEDALATRRREPMDAQEQESVEVLIAHGG